MHFSKTVPVSRERFYFLWWYRKWSANTAPTYDKGHKPICFYGAPVLTVTQLEQVIPVVSVVKVDKTPISPDLLSACVFVLEANGSVIGRDCDHRDSKALWSAIQPCQVAAATVVRLNFIVRMPVVSS